MAYIPVLNACSIPGICVAPPQGHDPGWESPICCDDADGTCWPGTECGGTVYFCHDGVSNEDGTVTCFEKEELW
ncbi:MAG: hypothetical protein HC927_03705 [Deltaproteobacteria bacterium]|nr:hypothetical protein [Deltaproteobacteria bacterium]